MIIVVGRLEGEGVKGKIRTRIIKNGKKKRRKQTNTMIKIFC